MYRLVAIFTLVLLSVEARANDPDADVRSVIKQADPEVVEESKS